MAEVLQRGNPGKKIPASENDTLGWYARKLKGGAEAQAGGIAKVDKGLKDAGVFQGDTTQDPTHVDYGGRRGGTSTDPDTGIDFFKR